MFECVVECFDIYFCCFFDEFFVSGRVEVFGVLGMDGYVCDICFVFY